MNYHSQQLLSYPSTRENKEDCFLEYLNETGVDFEGNSSTLTDVESLDCNELLCDEEDIECWKRQSLCQGENSAYSHPSDLQNLSQDSLISLQGYDITEDETSHLCSLSWLSSLNDELKEYYFNMVRVQQREIQVRRMLFNQPSENAVNPSFLSERHLLIEWLHDMCMELSLTPETFHTATFLMEFFSMKQKLEPSFLQVLAYACIIVAGKLEETEQNVPRVEELVCISRGSISSKAVTTMERILLEVLDWKVVTCNAVHFLRFYISQWCNLYVQNCKDSCSTQQIRCMGEKALYFINRAIMDTNVAFHSPSSIAACALYVVLLSLNGEKFLNESFSLGILSTDRLYFFGEFIGENFDVLQNWLAYEKLYEETSCSLIRTCSPTSIQQMFYTA
eukprot:jgi/Galph1/4873/GphlegSOOS_G3552.1